MKRKPQSAGLPAELCGRVVVDHVVGSSVVEMQGEMEDFP